MNKQKTYADNKSLHTVLVKTESIDEFFANMRQSNKLFQDKRERISSRHIISFVDPTDMLDFLVKANKYIVILRNRSETIEQLAQILKCDSDSIVHDIKELERSNLVKLRKGRVKLLASELKLEATI